MPLVQNGQTVPPSINNITPNAPKLSTFAPNNNYGSMTPTEHKS